jgi:hypothetical protein
MGLGTSQRGFGKKGTNTSPIMRLLRGNAKNTVRREGMFYGP